MSYATTPTERTPVSAVQGGCKSPSATRVYVRVRPFSHGELHEAAGPPPHTVKVGPQAGHITILDPENNYKPRVTYSFEHCFDSAAAAAARDGSDQEVVYQHVGKPVLHNVIDGYNGCIFAYGQTGSGKTYTMLGPPNLTAPPTAQEGERNSMCVTTPRVSTCKWSHCTSPLTTETSSKLFESQSMSSTMGNTECQQFGGKDDGLIPRLASDIFDVLRMKHKNNSTHSFRVEIEYYEIYNEKVFDLMISGSMNNRPELRLRYQPTCGAYVEGLVRKHVKEEKELLRWILRGSSERHVASTKMNDRSSRSHAILVVHIVQMTLDENDNGSRVNSKLNLVDLAGSERTGASGVEGKLFKEATKINLSLTALGRVIDALADLSAGKHGIFCPYRDSNLTWLLMDSLGGNSKTSMVATISPYSAHYEDMCQTLRYASRAKQIINKAVINEDPQVRQIKTLTAEVARLQHLLRERPQFDYKNEDVQRLQERVMQLEQDIVERDLSIDELRSQLLENNTETQKLADENNNLRRDAQEVKRLKVKVTRLQSELRAENEETEKLRQRLEAFKEEKEAHMKSALIIPSQPSNKETLGEGGKCNDVRLQLGYATAEGLNRLGIKAEDGNYERLIDSVTRYALDAKGKYETMLQRNTMMIDSHSHALRESLKQMEGKEWAILTATGEKLIASFEKAASKQNPTTPTSTSGVDIQEIKTPGRVSNEPAAKNAAEKLIVQYKDQIRRTQRELANVSALLRESKEHVRKGKENAGKLQRNNDLLQRQVDKLMNERDELKKNCEQQKKETEMLQTRENDVKKKLTATETILQEVENNMELLKQNNLEFFKAVVLLLEEELSTHHFLLIMEANERHSLLCRHHESLLHYDRQLAEDKMEEMRKEHNMTAEESAALARSLKEEIDVLNTANSQQEKHFKEFMSRISLAFHSHSDVWCASLHEKSQHLMEFYNHTAVLQEKENEIQNKLMLLKQNADTREEEAHFVLEKEMAKSAKTLLQKEEELNQMKELYTTRMQNQKTAQQLEMKMVCQSMEQCIKTVTQQVHDVLQLNKHREDMVIQELRNMYETSIQQLMEQMEHKEDTLRQLEDEFNTTKRQQLQDAEVQKEQLHNKIADMQSLMEQLKNDALETQNQLHETYSKKEKMLKDIITSTETSRDDALQKIADGSRLIQAAGHLMKENTLLYQEYTDNLLATVSSAVGDLRTEHTTHVMEMERTHTARLDELQREHEQRVRDLEKTADVAKAVLSQHRKVAEREALAMREAHDEQISSLARESCTIVAEHAAGRQSIAHEEGTARVDMAVALRHLTLHSLQRDEMSRELVDGHAAFLEHCVAEHAAWVEETCEVLASVDAAVKRRTEKWMEGERATSLIVSKQQECAQQLHESHVRMLLGELDSVQEWMGALSVAVSSAVGDLRTEHTTHVMEMERTHTARLDELQREHEQRVRDLEKTADVAKAVLSQHRKVAEREALAMREAHDEQISSLARESCTIVAEHAAGRQSIAHEEGTARVDMAVALRHLTLHSLQRDEMSRELVDGHAAFLEHCVAEHAAWVEETCEVLASVDAAVKRRTEKWMEGERATSLIVSKQQECAQQLHESHVRMLLGELDSVQEWMGALSVAVSSAVGDLRTEHTTHVMEMERTHTARLDELQREHEQRVRDLEKTADVAKAVLSQHRKVAEREALAMREAHDEQISSLARESCTIVAEHAAGRQSIAHEEGTARVDMAVALRHLTLHSLQRDEMSRELVDGHAAFLEHCVAEHAAWVEETCEVLASVDAAVKRRTEKWMEGEHATSLIVSKQQECAQQLHESHVRMLLGELDSVQEWMGALSVAVSSAVGDLRTEHTTHVMEMERTHTARLDELQREHEQRVRDLEKTADVAKAVLSQHRKVAEREALAMREAHDEQISSLARESCTIVAEHAAGRQSIAHEEGTARVDMAVALRHLTLHSLQRDEMSRELVDGHAAFLEHCVAEHAAWVEETCEVLASVDAAVKRRTEKWMEGEHATSLIVSKQQECAQQLHESHVRMLLGELDSVQEWMGALSVAVSSAMGDLRTEHTTHVMEMERTHTARLDELQREHEQRVRDLEKTADVAKAVLSQHRKVAEREALAMREAHDEQISSLARESCTIVAEHAAGRQSIAHEEGTARVDMAVALRHLTLHSLQRDEMSRELVDGHAAFLEHCVAEHAAWVEETCEVLASVDATTKRHAKECHELLLSACMKLMDNERAMLMAWEAGESLKLQAWAEMLLSFAQESGVLVSQVDVATKAVMFESDATASCEVSSTLNFALVVMMLLEQYKQRAFEEFTIHLTHLADARQMCSVSVATEFVKQEDEVMITALEDHLHQEILLLKKENTELKTNLGNVRADLEFQANLDKLEEEIVLRNGQQDNQRHGDGVLSGVYGGNEKGTMAKHHSNTNTGLGSYISSFFQRSATVGSYASPASGNIKTFSALKEDCDDRGTFASVRKPPPQSGVSSIPFTSPHPSLAARSKSILNQVQIVDKKLSRADGLSHTTGKSKKRESSV